MMDGGSGCCGALTGYGVGDVDSRLRGNDGEGARE